MNNSISLSDKIALKNTAASYAIWGVYRLELIVANKFAF